MKWTEITGVEKNVDFKVKNLNETYRVVEQPTGFQRIALVLKNDELTGVTSFVYDEIINAAPSGIIHLPPLLTDEQREQLKAIWMLGYRWLAKDKYGSVCAYEAKPYEKSRDKWLCCGDFYLSYTNPTKYLDSLVSWSDNEPYSYDIGKALGV